MKRRKMKGRNMKSAKLRKLLRLTQSQKAPANEPGGSAADPHESEAAFDVSGSGVHPSSDEHALFLAELGTGLWRLRQRMVQPGTGDPSEQLRWAYRHFEAVWDVLTQAGVEVQDHTGAPFDPGMALKVIAFQPTTGIEREMVTETIRPSMYYKGRSIQMGEVIVGTPETRDESESGR